MTSLIGPLRPLKAASVSGEALGLVHTSTSDTPPLSAPVGGVEILPSESRLKRMRQGVITSARLHDEDCQRGGYRTFAAMVTLTYAPGSDYSARHVTEYLKRARQWLKRRGHSSRYVWVLELTKAGRPHYHVLWWLPRGVRLPKPDKAGWWPHGSSKIEGARRPVGYLAKYASKLAGDAQGAMKEEARGLPKGARMHGVGGLTASSAQERRWWLSPVWVKRSWPTFDSDVRPAPGGGWCSRAHGEWKSSPWRVLIVGGRIFAVPALSPR